MTIRELTPADAEAGAALAGELGYRSTPAEFAARLAGRAGRPDLGAFAAVVDGAVVGWLDVAIIRHLDREPLAEICGLVVANAHRGQGTGARLVEFAEQWALGHGVRDILVRSNVIREAAHRFYRREGYSEWKRQAVFTKRLDTDRTRAVSAPPQTG
jgi:GNAT superfamily N-acetyltransferase